MALTFPRDMPTGGVDSMGFDLMRSDFLSPELSGAVGSVTIGFPRWRMSLTLANTTSEEIDEWRAFVDSLRGAQRTFFAEDLSRPFPRAYPNGFDGLDRDYDGLPFTGEALTYSFVSGDRARLNLSGLPANMDMAFRDMVAFEWETGGEARRSLHRYVEAGSTSSSGNYLDKAIEPPVPTFVPTDAVATLAHPGCIMRLIPGETSIGQTDTLHTAGGTVTAIQVVLP